MKIAILAPLVTPISEPQLGGSQALVADLAHGLSAKGHDVEVFAASGSVIDGVTVVDTGVDPETLSATLYRHGVPSSAEDGAVRETFEHVCRLIGRSGCDLVHNHAFDAPAVTAARSLEMPVVHTLHLPPEPHVAAALRAAAPAAVAAVSLTHAAAWRALVPIDAVLRNGVPVARIPWSAERGDGALFAGRLSAEKGAAEAIRIAVQAGMPLTLIGGVYDPAYARDCIEPWRTHPGIRIEPPLPRHQLWERMCRAAVVLCPVRWDEPFGLVAAEALAAGTPVVGFARGGLTEIVTDSRTGTLVDEGDVDAGAEAVAAVHTLDRGACRRHAEHELSIDTMLDAHETLYARVLRRAR